MLNLQAKNLREQAAQVALNAYCDRHGYRRPPIEVELTASAIEDTTDQVKDLIQKVADDDSLTTDYRESFTHFLANRSLALKHAERDIRVSAAHSYKVESKAKLKASLSEGRVDSLQGIKVG